MNVGRGGSSSQDMRCDKLQIVIAGVANNKLWPLQIINLFSRVLDWTTIVPAG